MGHQVGWRTWEQPGTLAATASSSSPSDFSSSSSSFSFLTIFSQANAKQLNKVNSLQAVEDLHYLPLKHSCHQDRLSLRCVKSLKPLRWICRSALVSQEMSPWLFSILSYCIDSVYLYTCVFAVLSKSYSEEKNTLKFKAVHVSNEIAFSWRWKRCAAFPLWKGVCSVYAQTLFFLSAKRVSAVYERVAQAS